jgi:hypothetical protein
MQATPQRDAPTQTAPAPAQAAPVFAQTAPVPAQSRPLPTQTLPAYGAPVPPQTAPGHADTPPPPTLRWAQGMPPQAPRPRRRALPPLLRLVSVLGLVVSGVGVWTMLTAGHGTPPPPGASPTGGVLERTFAGLPPVPTVHGDLGTPTATVGDGTSPSPVGAESGTARSGGSTGTATATAGRMWRTCDNYVFGYRISYPPGYRTVAPNDRLACRFFDTEPFTVTTDSPLPPRPIRISAAADTYENVSRQYTPAANSAVIDRAAVTVDGHPGFEMEIRTTTGKVAHVYVVDAGGLALVLDTYQGYCSDYAAAKAVLASMVDSLIFLSGDAG